MENNAAMSLLRSSLMADGATSKDLLHCRPSNDDEIRNFFWLSE